MKLVSLGLLLLVGGCAAPPAVLGGADPADPNARIAAVSYRSTIAPYRRQRPVDPAPWRERNEDVAPAPRP